MTGSGGAARWAPPPAHQPSLPAGWKLNPVVGAVYGPEFYAGNSECPPAPLPLPVACTAPPSVTLTLGTPRGPFPSSPIPGAALRAQRDALAHDALR